MPQFAKTDELGRTYAWNLLQRGVDYTHEQIMLYMLANPGATLQEIGGYFGYSGAYISQIKSSDAWKARFAELQGEVASGVLNDIPSKLRALGDLVVEKLTEKVEQSDDPRFIKESFDSVLHKLGYAPNKGQQAVVAGVQQNNLFVLGNADLAQARAAMGKAQEEAHRVLEGRREQLPAIAAERPRVLSDDELRSDLLRSDLEENDTSGDEICGDETVLPIPATS